MNKTEINWTDLTWNPVSGCTKCSEGCAYCYAQTIAENKRGTLAFPNGFGITTRPHKLMEPGKIKVPTLIFANSMSDFFHEGISDDYRDRIFDAIRATPRHRYQLLTKRPERAAEYFRTREVPPSVWLGVTVENNWAARTRIPLLQAIPARVRFLSIEPLLEDLADLDLAGIHWAIAGGESGSHLMDEAIRERRGLACRIKGKWFPREDRKNWIRHIRNACLAAGVAFWFKQWGGAVGPLAGRMLDGRTWDELPDHIPGAMPVGYEHQAPPTKLIAV